MKKHLIAAAVAMTAFAAHAEGDYKPFVMFDVATEKDKKDSSDIAREYIGANVTVGVKGPNKMEYSIKTGLSQKDKEGTQTVSNNIEFKVKKSYALTDTVSPYVALRLGEKIRSNGNHFTHYAVDGGVKIKLTDNLAFDTGVRYRNALDNAKFQKAFDKDGYTYESTRIHGMLLFDLDKHNTLGLRYAKSTADDYEEERTGWRVHYQHSY